jgi:hydroxyacylglutathione hydrolase
VLGKTKYRIFALLGLVIVTIVTLLVLAMADSLSTPVQRDNLTVHMLTVGGAKIYLVERSGKRIMIDSGNHGDEERIERYMNEAGFPPDSIDYLIITHGHLDHAGTAAYFRERYGIKVIVGAGDAKVFSEGLRQPLCATSALAWIIKSGRRGKTYPLFQADLLVENPRDLAELGIEGDIILMPGHTEGTLLVAFDDVIFVGDLVRGEVFRPEHPTRHFYVCDLIDNDADIQTLLGMTQFKLWFPGHFGPLTAAAVANIFGKG